MANNLSGEVATPDHLGCTPALPVIKHRGLYLPSLPLCSSTSPAPCGPMVERRRLGLDPSKLLGIQIVIGTNRFAKDGKSRNYVKIWQKLCERTKGLSQKVWRWSFLVMIIFMVFWPLRILVGDHIHVTPLLSCQNFWQRWRWSFGRE